MQEKETIDHVIRQNMGLVFNAFKDMFPNIGQTIIESKALVYTVQDTQGKNYYMIDFTRELPKEEKIYMELCMESYQESVMYGMFSQSLNKMEV